MAPRHLWFDSVLDGIFIKGLGTRLTPALKSELKTLGIDVDDLEPAYPVEMVRAGLELVHRHLFKDRSFEDALIELGASSLRGYFETILGRALLGVLRLIGVRRSLLRLNVSMNGGNNFMKTTSEVIAPNCIQVTFSDVSGMANFYRGIIEEGGRLAHAHNLRLTSVERPAPGHAFLVEWDD